MMMIDQSGVFIVDEAEHQVGGYARWSRRETSFRIDCCTSMSSGSGVSDATYFGAAYDNVQNSLRCKLCRLFIMACLALGECFLALVREQVLEMPFLEEVRNLKA